MQPWITFWIMLIAQRVVCECPADGCTLFDCTGNGDDCCQVLQGGRGSGGCSIFESYCAWTNICSYDDGNTYGDDDVNTYGDDDVNNYGDDGEDGSNYDNNDNYDTGYEPYYFPPPPPPPPPPLSVASQSSVDIDTDDLEPPEVSDCSEGDDDDDADDNEDEDGDTDEVHDFRSRRRLSNGTYHRRLNHLMRRARRLQQCTSLKWVLPVSISVGGVVIFTCAIVLICKFRSTRRRQETQKTLLKESQDRRSQAVEVGKPEIKLNELDKKGVVAELPITFNFGSRN